MLKEQIGQRLMVGIKGTHLDTETAKHLQEIKPGSVILFKRNISSAQQVSNLISQIKDILSIPPLIAIDQEGGRVIRFTSGITVFPGNMALGATGSTDLAYNQGLASASQLKAIGIDINLAPVVDVITTYHNPGITIRSFGDDPQKVADFAGAFIEGTQQAWIAAVAKHFPGKGAAEVDAHFDLPTIPISKELFEKVHFYPFKQAVEKGVKGIMTTHIHCPSLDSQGDHPATFSPSIVKDLLRQHYAFDGVIFSDDLEMGAIAKHYPIEDACRRATIAGHDMLLICSNYELQRKAFTGLLRDYSSSRLSGEELDESMRRLTAMRNFVSTESPSDQAGLTPDPEDLAQQIAQEAITAISDPRHLIPLTTQKTEAVHLLIPDLSDTAALEEGYTLSEEHLLVKECKKCFPQTLTFNFFSLNPEPPEIDRIVQGAGKQDTCILFISNAQENQGQKNLIKKVQQCYDNPLFVLLDNPFDCECTDAQDTCLTSYGLRKRQLLSLVNIIFGKAEPQGRLPFRKKDG
jgi:beta-N-acetylhexosaminidase